MKKCLLVLILGFCFKLLPAQTVFTDYADGQLYVKFSKASVKNIEREDPFNIPLQKMKFIAPLLAKYGVTNIRRPFYQASDDNILPYILKLKFSKINDVNLFMSELNKVSGVEYAEKVPLMKTDITPNDPTFPAQLTQINAPNAWNVFNGNSNITVAIVDNAIMWTHTDLAANTYTNTGEIAGNSIDDDGNGYVDDVHGWDVADNDNNAVPTNTLMNHGTHCAGIAGARNNNSSGIASIGWNIKIIPVKTAHDTSNIGSIDDGYGGIIYAAKANARVISCSWGSSGYSSTDQLVVSYAWNKGCIVVAAAGNFNSNTPSYPGAYSNVYCVSSVGSTDVKSGFSNYGTWVDIASPGENIYSTLPSASTGTFGYYSGTSMATPLVAGLAALMLSNCPYMTQTDVLNCISSSAVNIYTITGNTTYSTGAQLGAGRIDAYAAMNCSSGFINIAPLANFFAFPLNTCPSTPVNFYDSSLYLPTSRSWTFQSGSPATSTTTNPIVQWSSPGTYSVALSVSNTNGSNTKTKISYITIAGPIALPLAEGFQSVAFLPANWTQNNIFNDSAYWARRTGVGGFGTTTACAVFDNYNFDAAGERDEMRTPKYIFSNVTSARLRFDVAYARYDAYYSDSLEVKLSSDCGSTWTSIYLKGGTTLATAPDLTANTFTPSSTQWRRDSIDVTTLTAGQGNVMFSFVNRGHYGQPVYLDNINLAFPSPTLNTGLPASACMGTSFNFTNTSLGAGSYSWTFPGGTPATSTLSNPGISYALAGLYTITLSGTNGTTTAAITKTINIIAAPVIGINTPTICNGSSTTLTLSGASSYTWTNGPVSSSLSVSPSVTTVYTVTGTNGSCASLKTGTVFVNQTPTLTINSPTICSGNQAVLTPTGASSYTWTDGSTSTVAAILAPTPPASFVYTVTGGNGLCTSIQTASVFVNPTPTLSANSQSICNGTTGTLTVSGASSYSWNTGAVTGTLTLNPTLTTVYTVTGTTNGCVNTKTVSIYVQNTPTVTITNNPLVVCANGAATLVANGAVSYSWSNGSTNNSVIVTPTSSSIYTVTGSNTFCSSTVTVPVFVMATPSINVFASPSSTLCAGASATLNATGPYNSISWSGPGAVPSPSIVTPALNSNYTVTANNSSNGCNTSSIISIYVNANPLSGVTVTNATCNNSCSGSANASSSGGTPPYSYSLGFGNCSTLPCTNLCAGNYTLITNDAVGCSFLAAFTITAPANNLNAQVFATAASCSTCADGSGMVTLSGGLSPYTYTWLPSGGNQATANNLTPGCYTVTVQDANGCSANTATCVGFSTTIGIMSISQNMSTLLIYPNPAKDEVTIDNKGHRFDYALYNNLGQLVQLKKANDNNTVIKLEGFAKGIYMIEVTSGAEKIMKKLVVE